MTAMMFAGCMLVAFSVPFAVFCLLIAKRAQLVIVMLSSAFCWLLSLMLTSILWYLITPLQTQDWLVVPIAVILQEAARAAFIVCYARAERSFAVVSTNAIAYPMTDLYSSIAAGVGFALIHGLMFYGSILSSALGPGTHYADSCPKYSTFTVTAWTAFAFGIMHICWMVIQFDAFRSMNWFSAGFVVVMHLAAGFMTAINQFEGACEISIAVLMVLLLMSFVVAGIIVHRPSYRSKRRAL